MKTNIINENLTIIGIVKILTIFSLIFTFFVGISKGFSLWFFIILAYFYLLTLEPKSIKEIAIKSISYPLILLIVFSFSQLATVKSTYEMPFTYYLSQNFFSFLASALIIFFTQKHKLKNNSSFSFKHPLFWLALVCTLIAVLRFVIDQKTDLWWSDPANKEKIESALSKNSENQKSVNSKENIENTFFYADSISINFVSSEEWSYRSKINLNIDVQNLYSEVIEDARIMIRLELDYNKGKFLLNSKKNGRFIPFKSQNPIINLLKIKNTYNLSSYSELDSTIVESIDDLYEVVAFKDLSNYKIISDSEKELKKLKNYDILAKINNDHSNIWIPNEIKKLNISWELIDFENDSVYTELPKINLFETNSVIAKIYLKTSNSNGFSDYSLIKTIDLTKNWNNAFVDKNLTASNNIISNNKSIKCDRKISYNESLICLPNYVNWAEISMSENLSSIVIGDNKILGFYLKKQDWGNSKNGDLLQKDYINIYASPDTKNIKVNNQLLDLVTNKLIGTYKKIDKKDLSKYLKNKNQYFGEPVFIENYKINEYSRSIITLINDPKKNIKLRKLSFLNVISFNEQLLFLNYSVGITDHFDIEKEMKINNEIVTDFCNLNQ